MIITATALAACAPKNEVVDVQEPVTEPVTETEEPEEPTEAPVVEEPTEPEIFWSAAERQALAAALDREAIVDRVFEGRNIPAYYMGPSGFPYATLNLLVFCDLRKKLAINL